MSSPHFFAEWIPSARPAQTPGVKIWRALVPRCADAVEGVVVADGDEGEMLALGRFCWGLGALAGELCDPFLRLGGGAVVDRDVVAALGLEMPGHRIAHHAEPEKRHLRHSVLPSRALVPRNCDPAHATERGPRQPAIGTLTIPGISLC